MYVETLLEQPGDTNRLAAFYQALMSVGDMDNKSFPRECWMDDLNETDCAFEVEATDDENWMDDLDEAA